MTARVSKKMKKLQQQKLKKNTFIIENNFFLNKKENICVKVRLSFAT